MFGLSVEDIRQLKRLPMALRALADWHDLQESQADAMDMPDSAAYHRFKRCQFHYEAERIEQAADGKIRAGWFNGDISLVGENADYPGPHWVPFYFPVVC